MGCRWAAGLARVVCLGAMGCSVIPSLPAWAEEQTPSACLLGTFERSADLGDAWKPQYGAKLEVSPEHATHGRRSCKVLCPATPENHWRATGIRKQLLETDWRPYEGLRFDVHNSSAEGQTLHVEVRSGATRSDVPFLLQPGGSSRIELLFGELQEHVLGGGELDLANVTLLSVYLLCPESEVVLFLDDVRLTASGEGPLRVPEIDRAQRAARGAVAGLAPLLGQLPDGEVRSRLASRVAKAEARMREIAATAGGPALSADGITGTLAALDTLADETDVLRQDLSRERVMGAIQKSDDGAGYGLAVETSLRKVLRDYALFDSPLADPAEVSLCANEHEAVQVIVLPLECDLAGVRVEISDLLCRSTGAQIDQANVTWHPVGYVKSVKPRYEVDYVGWWPDPLLDAEPFDVTLDDVLQPVWVDVFAPPGTEPGMYEGTLTIRPANASPRSLKLRAHVWGFELPLEHHLKTAFSFSEGGYYQWYFDDYEKGKTELPQAVRRRLYSFLLDHRVSPTNIYRPYDYPAVPRWEDLEFCIERGLDSFNIGRLSGKRAYADYLRDFTARLGDKGWLTYAYVYGPDEIQYRTNYAELKEEAKRACELVHGIAPDMPILAAIDLDPDLRGYINAWVPLTSRCDMKLAREYQAAGDQVWWYWCAGGGHPGLYLDYPALDARATFWLCWSHNVDGFLYYAMNFWGTNSKRPRDSRWPDVDWDPRPAFDNNANINGSGVLVYPGREYGELRSSVRFENIRDGLEDYEYLWLLRQRTDAAAKAAPDSPVVAEAREALPLAGVADSLQSYTHDPQLLLGRRMRIARLIQQLATPDGPRKENQTVLIDAGVTGIMSTEAYVDDMADPSKQPDDFDAAWWGCHGICRKAAAEVSRRAAEPERAAVAEIEKTWAEL